MTMRSSSFAEKEKNCCDLMHEEIDELRVVFEHTEKKIEMILNSEQSTLN